MMITLRCCSSNILCFGFLWKYLNQIVGSRLLFWKCKRVRGKVGPHQPNCSTDTVVLLFNTAEVEDAVNVQWYTYLPLLPHLNISDIPFWYCILQWWKSNHSFYTYLNHSSLQMQYLCSGPLICHCRTSRCSENAVVHYSTTSISFKYFGHTILILFHHFQATYIALQLHFLNLLPGAVSLQCALENYWSITEIPLYCILF